MSPLAPLPHLNPPAFIPWMTLGTWPTAAEDVLCDLVLVSACALVTDLFSSKACWFVLLLFQQL